ncbi:hypothetical protein B0A49_01135 [Cryomyces minteri]|uniref:Uncharacterized protein n=1 Tax=Cryomyces minteri TaxID=331657 RepID=A0A4U0XS47_9PEZI|nr:hypothetical protein B0A49_01135 [Cryomyces minteri]
MASIPVFLGFGGSPEPQPPLETYIIHVGGGEALTSLSEKVKQTFRERAIYPVQNDRIMSLLSVWNVHGSPAPLRTWLADDDITFSVILKFFIRREADDILYAQMEDLVSPSQFSDPVAVPRHLVLPSNGPTAFQDLMQHIAQRDENPPQTCVPSNQPLEQGHQHQWPVEEARSPTECSIAATFQFSSPVQQGRKQTVRIHSVRQQRVDNSVVLALRKHRRLPLSSLSRSRQGLTVSAAVGVALLKVLAGSKRRKMASVEDGEEDEGEK